MAKGARPIRSRSFIDTFEEPAGTWHVEIYYDAQDDGGEVYVTRDWYDEECVVMPNPLLLFRELHLTTRFASGNTGDLDEAAVLALHLVDSLRLIRAENLLRAAYLLPSRGPFQGNGVFPKSDPALPWNCSRVYPKTPAAFGLGDFSSLFGIKPAQSYLEGFHGMIVAPGDRSDRVKRDVRLSSRVSDRELAQGLVSAFYKNHWGSGQLGAFTYRGYAIDYYDVFEANAHWASGTYMDNEKKKRFRFGRLDFELIQFHENLWEFRIVVKLTVSAYYWPLYGKPLADPSFSATKGVIRGAVSRFWKGFHYLQRFLDGSVVVIPVRTVPLFVTDGSHYYDVQIVADNDFPAYAGEPYIADQDNLRLPTKETVPFSKANSAIKSEGDGPHEFGHMMGLCHDFGDEASVMYNLPLEGGTATSTGTTGSKFGGANRPYASHVKLGKVWVEDILKTHLFPPAWHQLDLVIVPPYVGYK